MEKEETADFGDQKARAQEMEIVHSCKVTKVEERRQETNDSGRQVRLSDSPLRNQRSVTGQAQAHRENRVDLFSSSYRGGGWPKDKNRDNWHPPSGFVLQETTLQVRNLLSLIDRGVPHVTKNHKKRNLGRTYSARRQLDPKR